MQISFAPENQNSRNRIFPFNKKSPKTKQRKMLTRTKHAPRTGKFLKHATLSH